MDISAYQHMNIRMSTRGKRPLRNLTPGDKVRAIQRIHNGETKASVSRDIGVPESTLRGWCKNEQKLRLMCRQMGADQISISALENPPEKRLKIDSHLSAPKFSGVLYDNYAYNLLPLNGMDFSNGKNMPKNGTTNSIFNKIAFNEFMKKNNGCQTSDISKQLGSSTLLPGNSGIGSLPVASNFNQLAMVQNLNLLSLLNPHFFSAPSNDLGSSSSTVESVIKDPLRTSNTMDDMNDHANNNNNNNNSNNNNNISLTVKAWAKEPSPATVASSARGNNNSNHAENNVNDSNNNDIKTKALHQANLSTDIGSLPPTFPINVPPFPPIANIADGETNNNNNNNNNNAIFEWCKVFNASLNFLALAAAAASINPQSPVTQNSTNANANENELETTAGIPNILYKQLMKPQQMAFKSNTNSDQSNDSFFDSEPEDLSLRSITSKMSCQTNSRSQSPAKSCDYSTSPHSDLEQ